MNKLKKIIFYIVLVSLLSYLVVELTIPTLLISGIGIWYFIKKSPNRRMRNYAITLTIISFIFIINPAEDSAADTQVSESIVESSSVVEKEESVSSIENVQEEEERIKAEEAEKAEAAEAAEAEKAKAEEERKKVEAESIEKQETEIQQQKSEVQVTTQSVPEGDKYIEVNGNIPFFTNEDISSTEVWEAYNELDSLGRVTEANALLGVELMPAEERGDISSIEPTGWNQAEYSVVSGSWLYNRSHLIGYQLTGENANKENLITGTRWFNVEGMLPFENFVAEYIESTENHVRYRVTPHFEGENLLASGVFMEGMSIEDNGEALTFNIYVPNRQPDVNIDYATGTSWVDVPEEVVPEVVEEQISEPEAETEQTTASSGDVTAVDTNSNGKVTIEEAENAGFSMPLYSDHWLYQYMDDRDKDGAVGE